MDIRLECSCGQAYEFAVEPVNSLMPCPVACPACGTDGTDSANQFIRSTGAAQIPVPPPPATAASLRVNRPPPPPSTAVAPPPPFPMSSPGRAPAVATARSQSAPASNNMGLGIVGALLGAAVGAGLMYGFYLLTDLRFPLFGTGIGVLTGLGARMLYKGTDATLGVIAAGISLLTVAGTLYFMFGELSVFYIITMVVSVSFAYRIAS